MKLKDKTNWLVLSLLTVSFISLTGCVNLLNGIKGNGEVIKEERSIKDFSRIEISGAFEINLIPSDSPSLSIESDENIMPHIITRVQGNTLVIDTDKHISSVTELHINIYYTNIKHIDLSGAVEIEGEINNPNKNLYIKGSGASEMRMDIIANKLSLDMSGASEINLLGICNEVILEGSGASEFNAINLETKIMTINLSGAGEADVWVTKSLSVSVSGAGNVRYKGSPQTINERITGAGSVKPY
ncbi:MAG: head GIN domain-containing protein [Bacteroidota bacterium]|nr:head GIN domain-containing protein [Bacteroidota bacterium]